MGQARFGPFAFDADIGTLTRDGETVALGGRAAALLGALARAEGGVVTKAELMEAAWPGLIVEDGNITVQITALRKALGERPDGSEWIVTVPRVGYRLIRDSAAAAARQTKTVPVVAVLPFQNISGDPEQDYFADGVVQDIITALSRFRSPAVVARNSTFGYRGRPIDVRQVARELGAGYVVEGSVRKAGGRLRITAQLVEATSGTHLWARTFDGTVDDVFSMQDHITAAVAAQIEPNVHRAEVARAHRELPNSGDSYDLYLHGLAKISTLNPGDSAEGIALLERAIAADPDYIKAVAIAAWGYEYRLHMGMSRLGPDDVGRCLALARRALASAEDDPLVVAHCGIILQLCAHEWELGLSTIDRARTLNPHALAIHFFTGVGNIKGGSLETARTSFEHVIALNPAEANAVAGIACVNLYSERHEEALEAGMRALAGNPNLGWPHFLVIAANAHLGRMVEAERALDNFKGLFGDVTLERLAEGQATRDPARAKILIEGLAKAGLK